MTFLDTCGLVAKTNAKEQRHAAATRIWAALTLADEPLITTSLILFEIGDTLSRVGFRRGAAAIRAGLLASRRVEIVQITPDHERLAWEMFEQFRDKDWGLTDCVSFVIMEEREIQDAFTADRHFAQAGFTPLLTSA